MGDVVHVIWVAHGRKEQPSGDDNDHFPLRIWVAYGRKEQRSGGRAGRDNSSDVPLAGS